MRLPITLLAAAAVVTPLAVAPTPADARSKYKEWRGKDGRLYCRRTDGTTGVIVGAVGGALLGRAIDTRGDRTLGTVLGGAAGALAGREIEREGSKRRCVPRSYR